MRLLTLLFFVLFGGWTYGAETANKESGISEKAEYAKIQNVISNAVVSGDLRLAAGLVGNRNGELFSSTFELIENKNKVAEKRDVIINIASMTKLITTIAVLQLVEQGKIDLDKEINVYLPELSNLKILEGFEKKEPILTSPARLPLIRELITHTSGYAYDFSNKLAAQAVELDLVPSIFEDPQKALQMPLVFEPGSSFAYGISIDWLGILVERVSGLRLDEFFRRNIFLPIEMSDTFFDIPPTKIERSAKIWIRSDMPVPSLFQRLALKVAAFLSGSDLVVGPSMLQPKTNADGSESIYLGGAGLYSTTSDYGKVLQMLLNEGQIFGNQVLSSETVDMMFQNHIGNLDFSPGDLDFSSMDFAFGEKAKWGLGFMLHPEGTKNGRNKNSGSWLGLFNSYFWVDREAGIYGVFASQLLPTFDKKFVKHLISFEKEIYNSSRHWTNN